MKAVFRGQAHGQGIHGGQDLQEAGPPREDHQEAKEAQLKAMLGLSQEADFEEPDGEHSSSGHLAIRCTTQGCSSWIWMHRLYQRSLGGQCGRPWFTSFVDNLLNPKPLNSKTPEPKALNP